MPFISAIQPKIQPWKLSNLPHKANDQPSDLTPEEINNQRAYGTHGTTNSKGKIFNTDLSAEEVNKQRAYGTHGTTNSKGKIFEIKTAQGDL